MRFRLIFVAFSEYMNFNNFKNIQRIKIPQWLFEGKAKQRKKGSWMDWIGCPVLLVFSA
jgi:hypothetical protein